MVALVFGGFESIAGIAVTAGTVVLVLGLVAFGAMAYRHFTGGIEWPDDREDEDGVARGDDDGELKYY